MSGGVSVQGQESGDVHFATELEQKLGDYEKAWSRLRAKAGLGPVRKASVLDHNGTPDGKACKDYHKQCAWWADKVPIPPLVVAEDLIQLWWQLLWLLIVVGSTLSRDS